MLIEGIDYDFIFPENDPNSAHLKFISGPYKDTIFKYGKVTVEERDDQAYLLFELKVIESKVKPKKLEKDEEFIKYAGELLHDIIAGNMDQEFVDENGTTDISESFI